MLKVITVFLLPFIGVVYSQSEPKHERLVGGVDATDGKYPFIVSLQESGSHFCAGTLLSEFWVLTVAHSLIRRTEKQITVVYGITNLNSNQRLSTNVSKIITHENYSTPFGPINDIALLKLSNPVTIQKGRVEQVLLAPNRYEVSSNNRFATLIGWGTKDTDGFVQEHLQELEVQLFDPGYCTSQIEEILTPAQFCNGFLEDGKGSCYGDSGGPILYRDGSNLYQIGIESWNKKPCGLKKNPSVATKVSHYIDWIVINLLRKIDTN